MKRILYLILLALLIGTGARARTAATFTHYSSKDGLTQNTITSILQDRRGNLWFATWDGINRFDGYTFKNYKTRPGNDINLSHNRIDRMIEDRHGFLWLQTYDGHAYRFDPRTERFELVPGETEQRPVGNLDNMRLLPGGSCWLLTEHEGAWRVTTSEEEHRLITTEYSLAANSLQANRIYHVYEDSRHCEWLLTDNGLTMLPPDGGQPSTYFAEKAGQEVQEFYACQEHNGSLYFASNKGRVWRYDLEGGQFHLIQLPSQSRVVAVRPLRTGEFFMATAHDGFFLYHAATDKWEHYAASRLPQAPIRSAFVDRAGEVWLEQQVVGTVTHFNPDDRSIRIETVPIESNAFDPSRPSYQLHEDCYGTLWVHPFGGGLSYYDRPARRLVPFNNPNPADGWHFSNKLHDIFSDRQGNLWLSTHSKGLEKISFQPYQFGLEQLAVAPAYPQESMKNEVRALWEDTEHNVWVGTKDGRLHLFDARRRSLGYLTKNGTVATTGTPLLGNAYHIMQDRAGNLWISTKGDGLFKAEPLGRLCYRLTNYRNNADDIYSLSNNSVYCTYEDGLGRIWVATFGGGLNYLTKEGEQGRDIFIHHRNHLKGYPIAPCSRVRYITGDGKGQLWIGTTMGVLRLNETFDTPEEADFHHYCRVRGDLQSLSTNDVPWILSTGKGALYFATFGGGLNRLEGIDEEGRARFKAYSVKQGLPSDLLLSLQEDSTGCLWISTENGISRFDPSTEKFENYNDVDIAPHIRFSEATSAITSAGRVLFGTNRGVCHFHPDSISKSDYVPPIVFSDLLLANENVTPGPGSVLTQSLDATERLRLSHRENIFTIQYAALDYSAPERIQYAYILEGFDKSWNQVGRLRTATYTNLPKGNYVFKVRSTNADGVWTENIRSLPIEVMPSFWETSIAYCLYVLGILVVILIAVDVLFLFYRLKHKVRMERQMTDMKLRFFTDISHELRTPLTLIAGPVEYVMEHWEMPAEAREQLQVVERNTKRMLRLINQILDFRKIQNRKMKMQVQLINVAAFTRKIMENFDAVAEERRIDFLFETEKEELGLYVDADKYEKIVFNLLSNAFKYTPNDKGITVFLREDERSVTVGVQDQGIGIPENRRKSLFLRFENLVDSNLFNQTSTGIGLSLVKELVEMHKAAIDVQSKVGQGSCFSVTFLKGKEHFDEDTQFLQDDVAVTTPRQVQVTDANLMAATEARSENPAAAPSSEGTAAKSVMLLVEDNSELRLFLRNIFASDYRVLEAEDGRAGQEKAMKYLPDIIISDVMMPEKDGIAMTRELRADMATSHIPIILLTAKTAIESKLEGLEYGADDYITKPFSATYLKARVKNLLGRRRSLQELYRAHLFATSSTPQSVGTPTSTAVLPAAPTAVGAEVPASVEEVPVPLAPKLEMSPNDRRFLDTILAYMEKNIDNGDLLVDDLVREASVSRSVFFKKLKTLTGMAPVEFIREVRIQRAARLIRTGEYTITQIAYMVGINDPRYFSKCFKQQMGMTPSEYRDSLHS